MATQAFNRGISPDFIAALNDEYKKCGWWKKLVCDPETFVAIRGSSLNVYYRGCSLIRLEYKSGRLVGEIAYKYLLQPSLETKTIDVVAGTPCLEALRRNAFIETLCEVEALKKAAEPYAEGEKIGVHHIIHNKDNREKVIDVEIAFSDDGQADIAALHEVDGTIEVVFYEAKRFSNPELRAREDPLPVIDQVNRYSKLLKNHCKEVERSYRKVCQNLASLDGVKERLEKRHTLLLKAAESTELRINSEVRLLVFEFDTDQRDGEVWRPHRNKLRATLEDRLIMRGDPKHIRLT